MSYIDRNLLTDESILFRTRKHIIIFTIPILWTLIGIIFMFYMNLNHSDRFPQAAAYWLNLAIWFAAAFYWLKQSLEYYSSEYVVTNKRIMMREGFFVRHATELRLATIAQVNVNQSLLGQVLNYGIVSVNAFGVSDGFPLISRPFMFQRYVAEQLDKLAR